MSELQPGMLALVLRSSMMPESVGTIVTCEQKVFINDYGQIDVSGTPSWTVSGNDNIPDGAACFARNLMPLPPLRDPLFQKQQQELHA